MKKEINKINNNLVLELHIPDFDKARTFYWLFWFEEISYDPTSGWWSDLWYMILWRKDDLWRTMINFYWDKEKVSKHKRFIDFPENTPRWYGVEITIIVSDIEKLWNHIKEKIEKSIISQELTLKRWWKKDFRVIDPFGFYIRFTENFDWGQ